MTAGLPLDPDSTVWASTEAGFGDYGFLAWEPLFEPPAHNALGVWSRYARSFGRGPKYDR
jgi:hypothetical protein